MSTFSVTFSKKWIICCIIALKEKYRKTLLLYAQSGIIFDKKLCIFGELTDSVFLLYNCGERIDNMTYLEAFEKIKKTLKNQKADNIEGHLALQVNLTDEDAGGIFYIEVIDHKLYIEPYDFFDRDAMLIVSVDDFLKIMTSKLEYEKAIEDGVLSVYGNLERAAEIKKLIKKPAQRKSTTQKSTAKTSAAKKTTKK